MPLKPNGKTCHISEQIIEDLASGLTFQFEVNPAGETRLHVFGECLPLGNRTLTFDKDGENDGGGTHMRGRCKPAWLTHADDL